jgi:hypothetical protein
MYMAFASAALWMGSGLLTLIFVGSGRHARWEELWNANTTGVAGLEEGRAISPIVNLDATNATVDAKSTLSAPTAIDDTKTTNNSKKYHSCSFRMPDAHRDEDQQPQESGIVSPKENECKPVFRQFQALLSRYREGKHEMVVILRSRRGEQCTTMS